MPRPSLRSARLRATVIVLQLAIFPALASADSPAPPPARSWLKRTLGQLQLPPKVKQVVDNRLMAFHAGCAKLADRLECRLPVRLRPAFEKVRYCNPLTVSAFAMRKFKQDPVFMAGFGVVSTAVQYFKAPLLIAAGVAPVPAVIIQEATGLPVDLLVIAWRQHHLRRDRSQTFRDTVRGLFGEYRDFALARRAEARRNEAPGPGLQAPGR